MGVVVIVGTDKGGMLLRADDAREHWEFGELEFRGWRVTSATRDPQGRTYLAVALESFGNAILASDDLESWQQLEAAPRYAATDRGNPDHNRTISATTCLWAGDSRRGFWIVTGFPGPRRRKQLLAHSNAISRNDPNPAGIARVP